MSSPFRFAGIATAILTVCGSAGAQELAPPGTGVSIFKVTIESGVSHTVKYMVKGGSPKLQALVRRVEWAENELSVVEQMQLLKLDTVINERHLAAMRAAQLTNPYFPTGFNPLAANCGWDGETSLQRALTEQLAYEATPQAALQMIGFLEKMQTELDAQLKALPPREKKAARAAIDALRPRLAALSDADASPAKPQPVAPGRASGRSPIGEQQLATGPAAPKVSVEVEWHGAWYAAEILRVNDGSSLIHYTGWNSSWDEWVAANRIRPAGNIRGS